MIATQRTLRRRPAAFAGSFYPDDPERCRSDARQHLASGKRMAEAASAGRWRGGIVPHAGWVCSASIAGATLSAIAAAVPEPDLVVVFAAIHTPYPVERALLSSAEIWELPTGEMRVEVALSEALSAERTLFAVDDRFHDREHAVEVELPLVRAAWPHAAILPVEVPPTEIGAEVGRAVAAGVSAREMTAVYLASSDLTHYGPDYRFTPAGVGLQGLAWAKENDRRLLEKVLSLSPQDVVEQARNDHSACGPGAIAAMLSACLANGDSIARLLRHANSFETLADAYPQPPTDAVGYAALVVGAGAA